MATNASELQKYFANMDAEEERVAEDIGISPDEVRFYEMQNVGKDMLPPSMMRPKELASPVPRAAVGLERAGRQLRSPVDMPETVPPLAMPSGMPAKPSDFASLQKLMSPGSLASPIPVAAAPVKADVPSAVKTAIPATTATQPAPPPDGSGGDDEMGRLSMGQALVRALEGSGSVISGQNLRSGAADTLGERMKQIEALRAKREEQSLEQQRERATWGASNRATLASALAQWKDDPEKKAALEALASGADTTKPGDFSRNTVNAVMTRPKVLGAEAGVGKTVAQTGVATAQAAAVPKKLEQGDKKLAETAAENLRRDAREWARMRAAADAAASKASAGQPEVVQKEVRATTQKLGDSVAKEYGEISSALKEADRSLEAIKNQPPDVFAKVMQATNLDGLNTAEERALFRSVGELRRAAQKAQSGLAVTENERAEFLQLFGANWLQSPSSLIEAIEWMRRKTKDKLDQSFATYRAQGSVGNTAVQAYREAGGVTPDAQFLLPFNERQPKTAAAPAPAPAAQVGGMTRMTGPDGKKYDVPNDKAAAAKAKGWKE
jgi:hypothetical protein